MERRGRHPVDGDGQCFLDLGPEALPPGVIDAAEVRPAPGRDRGRRVELHAAGRGDLQGHFLVRVVVQGDREREVPEGIPGQRIDGRVGPEALPQVFRIADLPFGLVTEHIAFHGDGAQDVVGAVGGDHGQVAGLVAIEALGVEDRHEDAFSAGAEAPRVHLAGEAPAGGMDLQDGDRLPGNIFVRVTEGDGAAVKAYRVHSLLRLGEAEQRTPLRPRRQRQAEAQKDRYGTDLFHYSGQRILASV